MKKEYLFYLYSALFNFGLSFTFTTYGLFLTSIGLSFSEISLLNAFFWGTAILAEIPTGMLADSKSRSWSLFCGSFFFGMGCLTYFFAIGFWSAVFSEVLIGIGCAFVSGALQAWMTDSLIAENRDHEKKKIFATNSSISALLILFGGILGAFIAKFHQPSIWLFGFFFSLIAMFLVQKWMNGFGEPKVRMTEKQALSASFVALKTNKDLVWIILLLFILGFVVSFNNFWSLFFQKEVGVSNLSFVWFFMYGSCVVSGMIVRKMVISEKYEKEILVVCNFIIGGGMIILASSYSIPIFFIGLILHEFGRGAIEPISDSFVQHRIESSYRATFVSLKSFLARSGLLVATLLVSFLYSENAKEQKDIQIIWLFCGCVIILASCFLYLFRSQSKIAN